MATVNNDMDKKLRQLENQSLPDLSKQDQHWQQMRQLLQPGVVPAGKGKSWLKKWGVWLAAACIFSLVVIIGYLAITRSKEDKAVVIKTTLPVKTELLSNNDTAQHPPVITQEEKKTLTGDFKRQGFTTQVTYSVIPVSRDTIMPVPDVTNQPVISKKETVTLAGFFQQLEKGTQEFVIMPGRDTLVTGSDGSALLIPANTFNTQKPVTILLREFYSNEDIITNKLNTTSNGEQLVTGGMIHLMAVADGKEVAMNPGKSIRWFLPDTSASMKDMKLFMGDFSTSSYAAKVSNAASSPVLAMDTVSNSKTERLNWVADEQYFTTSYLETKVKVLDLQNNPYRAKETKKGAIGKFRLSPNSKISKEQLEAELKTKYGYAKVKVKEWVSDRNRKRVHISTTTVRNLDEFSAGFNDLGDSAWVSPRIASYYDLKPTDTITYTRTAFQVRGNAYVKKAFTEINLDELANRFSVDIRTLGWINCDRFYGDRRARENYIVDIKDTAANYYTVLVFEKFKSMIMGTISGNRVIFQNIPKGEPAKVICVGVQDGKPVAAIAPLPANGYKIDNLKFEETSPASFREQAAMIDK